VLLCYDIVTRPAETEHSEEFEWEPFLYGSERFEWVCGFVGKEGKPLIIRQVATGKSVGVILANDDEVSTEVALIALARMYDHLA
jgi:hypothetical protein